MWTTLPIIIEDGAFRYTYDDQKAQWLSNRGFSTDLTAEQAFNALRTQYEIDPQLDRYEAAEILQDTYSVYPPINIRSMTYTYDTQKEQFLEKYGLDTDLSAEEAFFTAQGRHIRSTRPFRIRRQGSSSA